MDELIDLIRTNLNGDELSVIYSFIPDHVRIKLTKAIYLDQFEKLDTPTKKATAMMAADGCGLFPTMMLQKWADLPIAISSSKYYGKDPEIFMSLINRQPPMVIDYVPDNITEEDAKTLLTMRLKRNHHVEYVLTKKTQSLPPGDYVYGYQKPIHVISFDDLEKIFEDYPDAGLYSWHTMPGMWLFGLDNNSTLDIAHEFDFGSGYDSASVDTLLKAANNCRTLRGLRTIAARIVEIKATKKSWKPKKQKKEHYKCDCHQCSRTRPSRKKSHYSWTGW